MDYIWLAAPSPAIRLGPVADRGGWRVNPAAEAWAAGRGLSADMWPSVAAELLEVLPAGLHGSLATLPLQWRAVALEDGWLVWLSPTAYLERALELAKVSVWKVDYPARRIHFNDVGYELIERTPQQDGIDLDELRSWAHPDDVPDLLEAAELAEKTGEVIDVDLRFRLP
ncbi:MAG: hypothetical protein ABUL50_05490, partial [Rhizobacter sp.]